MSWLGDVFSFEAFNLKDMLRQARKNPEQLLLGAADPFSAKMWSKITGKKYEPIINQWGGASDGAYQRAEAAGINTGAGRQAHGIAQTIASIYAGGAAAGALGGAGGASGAGASGGGGNFLGNLFGRGATATNNVGPLSAGYAYTPTVANSVGPLASGYNYGMAGYYGATPALSAAGAPVVAANGSSLLGTGAASNGLSLQQFMDLAQQMPQGGQQEQPPPMPAPMAPGVRTTQGGLLGPIYDGERDLVTKRRKRRGA